MDTSFLSKTALRHPHVRVCAEDLFDGFGNFRQSSDGFWRKLEIGYFGHLLDLFGFPGTEDSGGNTGLLQNPGNGNKLHGRLQLVCDLTDFCEGGEINCFHAYWIEDAIRFKPDEEPEGWKEQLATINGAICGFQRDDRPVRRMIRDVVKVSEALTEALGGEWSIDFCLGKDGTWYFIDTAPAELSWHPPHDGEPVEDEISIFGDIIKEMEKE